MGVVYRLRTDIIEERIWIIDYQRCCLAAKMGHTVFEYSWPIILMCGIITLYDKREIVSQKARDVSEPTLRE